MRRRRHLTVSGAVLVASAALAPAALASNPALADCSATGHLSRSYSASQLRGALTTMPADVKEYTDCYDVIQRTLFTKLASTHKGGGGGAGASSQGSSGSVFPPVLIVVLALLLIAAVSLAAVALRRRGAPREGPS